MFRQIPAGDLKKSAGYRWARLGGGAGPDGRTIRVANSLRRTNTEGDSASHVVPQGRIFQEQSGGAEPISLTDRILSVNAYSRPIVFLEQARAEQARQERVLVCPPSDVHCSAPFSGVLLVGLAASRL